MAERLGIGQAADQLIDLGDRPGAANPGAKLLTVVHAMVAGGDCIDDTDLLRCGSTASVLGHRVMAPSTAGTFPRAFTFGHTRQLDQLTERALASAWAAGAGPGDGPMTIDANSTIVEVTGMPSRAPATATPELSASTRCWHQGRQRRGAARQAAGRAGQHRPRHAPVRRRAGRPVRRAGASGELTIRMDSGFWAATTLKRLRRHGVRYSITVRQPKPIRQAIQRIGEEGWTPICYPDSGVAEVAETAYKGGRLIVRRVRRLTAQGQLFPTWTTTR